MPPEDPVDLYTALLTAQAEVRTAAQELMDAIARRDALRQRINDMTV